MSQRGFVVWFTGLSGSGKSTLAAMLAGEIARRGTHVETLDGDEVRMHLSKGLGYVPRSVSAQGTAAAIAKRLILPHGGELVDRWAHGAEKERASEKAKSLPGIVLDERAAADVENIAVGAFSPLKGFMTSKDYLPVVREMRLENGLVWSVPSTLAVSQAQAESIRVRTQIALP